MKFNIHLSTIFLLMAVMLISADVTYPNFVESLHLAPIVFPNDPTTTTTTTTTAAPVLPQYGYYYGGVVYPLYPVYPVYYGWNPYFQEVSVIWFDNRFQNPPEMFLFFLSFFWFHRFICFFQCLLFEHCSMIVYDFSDFDPLETGQKCSKFALNLKKKPKAFHYTGLYLLMRGENY